VYDTFSQTLIGTAVSVHMLLMYWLNTHICNASDKLISKRSLSLSDCMLQNAPLIFSINRTTVTTDVPLVVTRTIDVGR
jgi:hypothetical protein